MKALIKAIMRRSWLLNGTAGTSFSAIFQRLFFNSRFFSIKKSLSINI